MPKHPQEAAAMGRHEACSPALHLPHLLQSLQICSRAREGSANSSVNWLPQSPSGGGAKVLHFRNFDNALRPNFISRITTANDHTSADAPSREWPLRHSGAMNGNVPTQREPWGWLHGHAQPKSTSFA